MPDRVESCWASPWIRWFAASVILRRNASAGSVPVRSASSKDSAAIRDATSPAWAPPIPSATTNSGALAK